MNLMNQASNVATAETSSKRAADLYTFEATDRKPVFIIVAPLVR